MIQATDGDWEECLTRVFFRPSDLIALMRRSVSPKSVRMKWGAKGLTFLGTSAMRIPGCWVELIVLWIGIICRNDALERIAKLLQT